MRVDNSTANGRALVEMADGAYPMITIGHDERQPFSEVAANKENWRERLAFLNSLQVVGHV